MSFVIYYSFLELLSKAWGNASLAFSQFHNKYWEITKWHSVGVVTIISNHNDYYNNNYYYHNNYCNNYYCWHNFPINMDCGWAALLTISVDKTLENSLFMAKGRAVWARPWYAVWNLIKKTLMSNYCWLKPTMLKDT